METNQLICGDLLQILPTWPDKCVDLVFGSPPYESQRTYGIGFNLKGQQWVDWMVEVYRESSRICRGLVAFVVAGHTKNFKWSATPALLMADLHRAGFNLRCPPIYQKNGLSGSGGPDWLRCDYEHIICVTPKGKLLWSDNLAMGSPPKYGPGGAFGNRNRDGSRANNGKQKAAIGKPYVPPAIANPGNVIHCVNGGGNIGSKLAHETEAPFSERIAEFMIRSFCPPDGIVLDPFSGSATTPAVAIKTGRNYIGIDIRQSQIELGTRRIEEAKQWMTQQKKP